MPFAAPRCTPKLVSLLRALGAALSCTTLAIRRDYRAAAIEDGLLTALARLLTPCPGHAPAAATAVAEVAVTADGLRAAKWSGTTRRGRRATRNV